MGARSGNWEQSRLAVFERHLMDAMYAASKSRLLRLIALVLAFGVAAFTLYQRFTPENALPCSSDFYSYYHSALGLRGGIAPYGPVANWLRTNAPITSSGPFTDASCLSGLYEFSYTPILGLLFIPFTVLPYTVALLVWDGCNLLLLGGAIYAILRIAGMRPSAFHLVLLTVAATLISPMRFALYFTQADLLVLFLICAALWVRTVGRSVLGGLLLGLSCAIEPVLLAFAVPFLLWKREFKLAAITLGTSAALIFVPFLWLGGKALQDLLVVWRFNWSAHGVIFFNNAPRGILLRLFTLNEFVKPLVVAPGLVTPLWLLLALAILLIAGMLITPRPLSGDSRSLLDVGFAVTVGLLLSPWSENNHFTLLLVPFLAVYVLLFRLDFSQKQAHILFWGFLGALFLAFVFGDPVQYAMVSRMTSDSPLRFLFLFLAVPYLYTLLAIAAVMIYALRLLTSRNGPQTFRFVPTTSPTDGQVSAPLSTTNVAQFERLNVSALPRRVHIVGGPGSGKTTLSRQLAVLIDAPVFELDTLAEAGPAPTFRILRPLQERLQELDRIAAWPGWVTEGSYLWWTDALFKAADVVIWLDVPARSALWNVFVRHWRDYISDVTRQPTLRQKLRSLRYPHLRHLISFLPYTWKYYRNPASQKPAQMETLDNGRAFTRTATALVVEGYGQKVLQCTRLEDISSLLQCLDSSIDPLEGSNTMDANTQLAGTHSAKRVSAYAEMHKADWIPVNYDQNIYDPAGYDTFAWELYRPYLIRVVQGMAAQHEHMKYLDFACGTGRIISALEGIPTESVGLDISPQMVEYARSKVSHSELRCGDILAEPNIVDADYDLITAFRFFLNTEPEMRSLVMSSLARHLAGEHSRLIFNIHLNGWSVNGLKSLYTRLRGWGPRTTMTYPMVRRLVEDAGLEIERWYGFALWPDRLYRSRLGPLLKGLDRRAARIRPLRWIGKDLLFICRPRKGVLRQDALAEPALQNKRAG